ncbi:MAG: ABC transporter permease [Agriterribacter sp.]
MFKNYLKIAIRSLWRNKGFSVINIVGLSVGIATCLIIMMYVSNELSYDRYNDKSDRMVRVYFQGDVQGEIMKESSVMPPVAQALKADYPEVEAATRTRQYGRPKIVYNNQTFRDDDFAFVDSNFFQVFTLPLIKGDARTALLDPNSIVITEAIAHKYFGNEEPMGKVIAFKDGNHETFKVTGVIKKVPENSHFHFDIFGSMASLPESKEPTWMSSNFFTYLVLAKGYDYKKLEAKLPQVVDKYIGPQMLQGMGVTLEEFRKKGNNISFHLQPITDIHLYSDFSGDLGPAGDPKYVYIFGAIAVFMLVIACINFMNLSTAGASRRSREVGIRKVLGSLRLQLVRQFLLESVLITFVSLLLALVFMKLALPVFNQLADQRLTMNFAEHPFIIPGLLLFIILVGVLAGSYPAFYLSSFKPVAVLKGKFISGKGSIGLRSGLVVFQFFISIILIVSTAVVYKQLSYIQHKELGYNKDQVLVIPNTWTLGKNQQAFKQLLMNDPRVASITNSGFLPAGSSNNNNFFVSPQDDPGRTIKTLRYDVDENYIPTLGIQLLAGRNFSKDFSTDSAKLIINETAANVLGWKDKAVGHYISRSENGGNKVTYEIIGIVKDFHFRSLHQRITPLVMEYAPDPGTLIAKLNTKDIKPLTTGLQKKWMEFGAEEAMDYSFLDDRFNNTYKMERNTGSILGIFAGLTIFVACLGLFGLATFTAKQRNKEIGIRKVLGATVTGIVTLLSKEFLKLVAIAFLIAAPIAWYIMNKWLQDFEYRTTITWWIFALAAVAAIIVTFATISFQAIKAALANPVKALRTE